MHLFYSCRKSSSAAFLDEFEKWATENPNFNLIPTIDDTNDKNWKYNYGYINEDMITKHIKDIKKPIYYVFGPPEMVDAMLGTLSGLRVDKNNIRFEKFG